MQQIVIAGIGPGARDYITPAAWQAAAAADILVGGRRNLEIFRELNKETYLYTARQEEMLAFVLKARRTRKVCVLVSGDPGFYSLLDFFLGKVGAAELEVIPGISSFQYMFARLKKPWKNYALASMHGRETDIVEKLAANEGLFLLTDRNNNPARIAAHLLEQGLEQTRIHVGENLSYENERLVSGRPADLVQETFSDLCVVVIEKDALG